ncbi:hypothetical protein [Mucilaginibacter aquaedulcis]|uniref:hypothetical protein n=1 Tax=Mucilaginibacter aquaedulcis TaxID=1187081 RepID=UPI0025B5B6B7|nr:hypothetical protein [Mucilaginibacter aquaedulcis]MDN3550275.1 hypothetical protein [Mucilaginibacter aquaedulcis]
MTKPANSSNKPSPSDTPTKSPHDNGGKSKVRQEDKQYHADKPHGGNIAKKHEKEEQPVDPIKNPPKEKGMKKGKVQP